MKTTCEILATPKKHNPKLGYVVVTKIAKNSDIVILEHPCKNQPSSSLIMYNGVELVVNREKLNIVLSSK